MVVTTEKDAVRFPRLDRRDISIYGLYKDIKTKGVIFEQRIL